MKVIVFRTRLKPDVDLAAMSQVGQRMYELGSAMPGFISYKDFVADDGENVTIVEFESDESLAAWRDHPEHKEAQRRGREEFFEGYHIQVCSIDREYGS